LDYTERLQLFAIIHSTVKTTCWLEKLSIIVRTCIAKRERSTCYSMHTDEFQLPVRPRTHHRLRHHDLKASAYPTVNSVLSVCLVAEPTIRMALVTKSTIHLIDWHNNLFPLVPISLPLREGKVYNNSQFPPSSLCKYFSTAHETSNLSKPRTGRLERQCAYALDQSRCESVSGAGHTSSDLAASSVASSFNAPKTHSDQQSSLILIHRMSSSRP
jgi:hypothetical protein